MRRLSVQILALNVVITTVSSSSRNRPAQDTFAYKLYKAQLMESYNQNRNMVISPSSSYRMLHAFCIASSGKTQKELRQLVSCKPRETEKIDKVFRKVDHRKIRVCFLYSHFYGFVTVILIRIVHKSTHHTDAGTCNADFEFTQNLAAHQQSRR